jgi:hypothetical protein
MIEMNETKCPRCGVAYSYQYFKARDDTWRAISDPCEICGYVIPYFIRADSASDLLDKIKSSNENVIGLRAKWQTSGQVYHGVIEQFIQPTVNLKTLGQQGIQLFKGNLKSKFPRFLLCDDNGRYHAIKTRVVYIFPFAQQKGE